MSVVEMMVACIVVALLGLMVINFLFPAMIMSAQGSIRAEMQQRGAIAINRMVNDLEQASIGSVGFLPPNAADPTGIGIVRLLSSSDASQVWETGAVCYFYYPSQRRLTRETYPPDPPALGLPFNASRPLRISPADLLQIANQPNATEMTLAGDVEAFTVTNPGRSLIEIRLTLQQTVPHSQKLETLELRRAVTVRNDS